MTLQSMKAAAGPDFEWPDVIDESKKIRCKKNHYSLDEDGNPEFHGNGRSADWNKSGSGCPPPASAGGTAAALS